MRWYQEMQPQRKQVGNLGGAGGIVLGGVWQDGRDRQVSKPSEKGSNASNVSGVSPVRAVWEVVVSWGLLLGKVLALVAVVVRISL